MSRADPLLIPGETCWRIDQADRAAFLVDGADYFAAVKAAMLSARQSIWLLAWVFDPLTRFQPDRVERSGDPANPDRLGLLLRRLAVLNPALDVRILAWDMPPLMAFTQRFPGQRARAAFEGSPVKFRLDNTLPNSACHHQKVLVVDGRLAFISGGDLGADRWDTCDHLDEDPHRRLPWGKRYPPRHDVALMAEGPIAQACGQLFVDRWQKAGCGALEVPEPAEDSVWPDGFAEDLVKVDVALTRTEPAWRGQAGTQEGLKLHFDCIAAARRTIFLENQYLASPVIVEALCRRLEEVDGPEVIAIGPSASPSFFDRMTMDSARLAAINRLENADYYGRFRAFTARTARDEPIIVHSKVSIFDDRLIRIGSANLNNRSGGLDTEVDAAIEAADTPAGAETRRTIAAFRTLLIGHYFGRGLAETQDAIRETGSVAGAIDALDGHPRRLHPIERTPVHGLGRFVASWSLGDPLAPSDAWRPWTRRGSIRRALEALPEPESRSRQSAEGDRTPSATPDRRATRSAAP
ncbi:MAG TPA: phospholipase D-like domain-containing protein [Caulobacter sp.]|nr:phospholipase D-like domain-containing protein [Caulobacter sp.]